MVKPAGTFRLGIEPEVHRTRESLPGNIRQRVRQLAEYCVPTVVQNINAFGGIDEGKTVPRKIDLKIPPGSYQPSLFG